jgi:2-keto-3-deoxy-L-rhamnonate aldolase RhmA
MHKISNPARQRLEASEVSVGAGLYLSRTAHVASLFAQIGYDWLFLDMEHNAMGLESAAGIIAGAIGTGISPIARVPPGEYGLATRLLDAGALGIVMPHVDTVEDAKELVRQLRYPPVGGRSCGYGSPHFGFGPVPIGEALEAQNSSVLVVAMLETETALRNMDAIAAVPGIDILMIGTIDLTIDMGIPGQASDPRIDEAYDRLLAACARNGKFAGMAGILAEEQAKRYLDNGVRFVLAGGDLAMLVAGARQRLRAIRPAP